MNRIIFLPASIFMAFFGAVLLPSSQQVVRLPISHSQFRAVGISPELAGQKSISYTSPSGDFSATISHSEDKTKTSPSPTIKPESSSAVAGNSQVNIKVEQNSNVSSGASTSGSSNTTITQNNNSTTTFSSSSSTSTVSSSSNSFNQSHGFSSGFSTQNGNVTGQYFHSY